MLLIIRIFFNFFLVFLVFLYTHFRHGARAPVEINDSFYDDIEHFNLNDDDNDFEDDYDDLNYGVKKGLNKIFNLFTS